MPRDASASSAASAAVERLPMPAFMNVRSGRAAKARALLARDPRFEVRELGPREIAAAVMAEADLGTRRVLVCGGDGTIGMAAGTAAGTALEVAVLPGGTLNHFARDFGLPVDDPAAALDVAATGTAVPVDLGYLNGQPMLNTSAVGAYVDFVRHREAWRRWVGYRLSSAIAGLRVGLRPRVVVVELRADDGTERRFRTPLLFVGVAERELRQDGLGTRRDGGARLLHVLVLNERRPLRIARVVLGALVRGLDDFVRRDAVSAHLVSRVTAELPRAVGTIAVDGELVLARSPLHYELRRDAVLMVRGRDASRPVSPA